MFLTLGEAAKQSGFSKATISRAIRDGKLSAQRSPETQSFKIDPAELHRYTEAMQVVRNTAETAGEKHAATSSKGEEKPAETGVETRLRELRERIELEGRAKLAEERLADIKGQLDEMRRERDRWATQAERLMIAAPIPMPSPVTRSMNDSEPRAGWWPWRRRAS